MSALWSYTRVLILVGIAACTTTDPEDARRRKCTSYRDHVVSLRLADLPATKDQQRVIADHRAAMTQALGDEFVATCEQKFGDAQLDCALAARDVASATRCVDR